MRELQQVRQLTADLFVSLDLFAQGIGARAYFGYAGPELAKWITDNLARPQVLVLGRVTYEALSGISASATDATTPRMNELPKLVFSNTLREPLTWSNSRIVAGDAVATMRESGCTYWICQRSLCSTCNTFS